MKYFVTAIIFIFLLPVLILGQTDIQLGDPVNLMIEEVVSLIDNDGNAAGNLPLDQSYYELVIRYVDAPAGVDTFKQVFNEGRKLGTDLPWSVDGTAPYLIQSGLITEVGRYEFKYRVWWLNQANEPGFQWRQGDWSNTVYVNMKDADPVVISFFPMSGQIGDEVTITGENFGGNIHQVTFNGTQGTIISSTDTQVIVKVPTGATSGIIAVIINVDGTLKIANSASDFSVIDTRRPNKGTISISTGGS